MKIKDRTLVERRTKLKEKEKFRTAKNMTHIITQVDGYLDENM